MTKIMFNLRSIYCVVLRNILFTLLGATTGLVQDTKKVNDGSPKNTDVLLGDQEDKNISEYKGFFIKQKPTDTGNKNESSH